MSLFFGFATTSLSKASLGVHVGETDVKHHKKFEHATKAPKQRSGVPYVESNQCKRAMKQNNQSNQLKQAIKAVKASSHSNEHLVISGQ